MQVTFEPTEFPDAGQSSAFAQEVARLDDGNPIVWQGMRWAPYGSTRPNFVLPEPEPDRGNAFGVLDRIAEGALIGWLVLLGAIVGFCLGVLMT